MFSVPVKLPQQQGLVSHQGRAVTTKEKVVVREMKEKEREQ